MTKPKLLIVGAFPSPNSSIVGGIATTCENLMESDFPNHFELILIDSTQRSNPPPGFFIRSLSATSRIYRYLLALVFQRLDAVILFTSLGASLLEKGLLAWVARLKGIPVFLFPRGAELITIVDTKPWQKKWIIPAMRGATHMLCQGPAWQRFAVEQVGFELHQTEIIHNWTANSELLSIGSKKNGSTRPVTIKILFLGWLERNKGIFELLESCKNLSKKYNFILSIAGDGHAQQDAKKFVTENELEQYVDFMGWVHSYRKLELLESTDILVLPSWAEGFPNAVIEAMAAKVAVVVTAVGNVPDILTNREHALIIPPKNVEALTVAIEELLIDSNFRLQLANSGHDFARETFSTERGAKRLANVIFAAIADNKRKKDLQ